MLNGFFGKLFTSITNKILQAFSRKEEKAERTEFVSYRTFSVHCPKWIYPLSAIALVFFGGFAYFCYAKDFTVGMYFFIAFCLFTFLVLLHEIFFELSVDGQEIRLRRFLRRDQYFMCKDIVSVTRDNANNIKVFFGKRTVRIDGTMVNAIRFYEFAHSCVWQNLERGEKQIYAIKRGKDEVILLTFFMLLFGSLAPYVYFSGEAFKDVTNMIGFFIFCGFAILLPFYLVHIWNCVITIDEINRIITYRRGFVKCVNSLDNIVELNTKKRLLDTNAKDYIMKIEREGKKPLKKKFTSLDDNSERLVAMLYKELYPDDEDEDEDDDGESAE